MIPIFIGYDTDAPVLYHTCVNSIVRLSSQPICVIPLALNLLKDNYLETHKDGSNQFIYSRFLVPSLMKYQGHALYIDGDMILQDDIVNLWNLKSNDYAVQVVKHNYITKSSKKYLGNNNENFPCKNWSSVILWNCSHDKNLLITSDFVQKSTGAQLHRFTWLDHNIDIGGLPIEWNWLSDEFGNNENAKLIHYTLGAPCYPEFSRTNMADNWHKEKELMEYYKKN